MPFFFFLSEIGPLGVHTADRRSAALPLYVRGAAWVDDPFSRGPLFPLPRPLKYRPERSHRQALSTPAARQKTLRPLSLDTLSLRRSPSKFTSVIPSLAFP